MRIFPKRGLTNLLFYLGQSQLLTSNQAWTATKHYNDQKHQNILRDVLFTKLASIIYSYGKLIELLS